MWNRNKREDEIPTRPAPAADPVREAIPTSTFPTRRSEEMTTRAGAVIGKTVVLTGQVTGREDLVVDGRVEGDIDLPENRLTIGYGGHVDGSVHSREVVIYGSVHGNIEATERVEIKKNAKVVGDLRTARPVIEDEAYFKGNVETVRVEAPKPQPQPARPAAAAAAATAPSPETQKTLPIQAAETKKG
jgi:cytoskeletal protein CcmA (bactofilin family)